MTIKPLPQAAITAARLRRMAEEMLLEADKLEAEAGLHNYKPNRHVEFEHSRQKRRATK